MREECTVSSSSATATPSSSWWDVHHPHANSVSSFYHKNSNNPTYNRNASCEDDVSISTTSITNASNHSGLTAESSHHCLVADQSASSDELLKEHVSTHNHLWNHVLLHGGSSVDLHDSARSLGEQTIDHPLASRNSSTSETFEPACDNYLKKMDGSGNFWNYTNQLRYGINDQSLVQSERLSKLSNLVGNWSIAPPNPDMNHHFDAQTSDISLCSTFAHQYKQTFEDSAGCYGHDLKVKSEDFCYNHLESSNTGYYSGLGGSMIHSDGRYINGIPTSPCESSRSFLDIRLTRPLTDINPSFKPCLKSLSLSEFKKKELQNVSLTTGTPGIVNEGKKKRCEEMSDEVSKKAKSGSSTASPAKELPKAKLRDKITTLQQIVSPFGKTDTASVLQEAITYIKFLQEQVKLLSTPYMKNSLKDPWGGWEREDNKGETKYIDLRSRGLCLVPISCTPHAYRESTGADYWSPTYRGCLYR